MSPRKGSKMLLGFFLKMGVQAKNAQNMLIFFKKYTCHFNEVAIFYSPACPGWQNLLGPTCPIFQGRKISRPMIQSMTPLFTNDRFENFSYLRSNPTPISNKAHMHIQAYIQIKQNIIDRYSKKQDIKTSIEFTIALSYFY